MIELAGAFVLGVIAGWSWSRVAGMSQERRNAEVAEVMVESLIDAAHADRRLRDALLDSAKETDRRLAERYGYEPRWPRKG